MTTEKHPRPYDGPDRRVQTHISDEQIEVIAEKAAEKAIQLMTSGVYKSIGKSVVDKFLWLVGALSLGAWLWAKKNGLVQ